MSSQPKHNAALRLSQCMAQRALSEEEEMSQWHLQ